MGEEYNVSTCYVLEKLEFSRKKDCYEIYQY